MKTKFIHKILFTALLTAATCAAVKGQGFYTGVNIGYGFAAGSQVIGVDQTATTEENVKGSYGQGLNFGVNLIYMFSENLGAELGFGMLMGKEFTITDNSSSTTTGTTKMKGSMIRVMPGLRVSAGDDAAISPFARFGLVVGVGGKIKEEATWTGSGFSGIYEYEASEGSSMGWYGAFGAAFELSEKMRLTAELITINQTFAPKKYENTANSDGSALDPAITLDDNVSSSATNTWLKHYLPFGSTGLNVGVLIGF